MPESGSETSAESRSTMFYRETMAAAGALLVGAAIAVGSKDLFGGVMLGMAGYDLSKRYVEWSPASENEE